MAVYILVGFLASYGALCILWAVFGFFLFRGGRMIHLCLEPGQDDAVIQRYCWLYGMGILKGPLVIVGSSLSCQAQRCITRKCPHIEFCCPEDLSSRLELERMHFE